MKENLSTVSSQTNSVFTRFDFVDNAGVMYK